MKAIGLGVLGSALILALVMTAVGEGGHAYVGPLRCKMCHSGSVNGSIFESWEKDPHHRAYETLSTPAALKTLHAAGREGDPQREPDCLRCHVTGFGKDSTLTKNLDYNDGISCEECHGAGADYRRVMKDYDRAVAAGLNPEPEKVCVNCHNKQSPAYRGFEFEKAWGRIRH